MRIFATTLLVMALAACQAVPAPGASASPATSATPIADADAIVKAADWSKAETITVVMGEHHYTPMDVRLTAGKPYKMVLKNEGDKDHYYTAAEFFKNIAWRKAMVNKQAEIKAPYFTAVEVLKKTGQLDLYFVAVNKGTYPVICTIDDHREKGMEGSIVVE